MIRIVLALAIVVVTTAAHARFDLDPRIRPRLDGSWMLPGPFDQQDAAIEVGTLGECDDGYLSCSPSLSCEGEGACCPSEVQVGQSLLIPNPFRLEVPGPSTHRTVRMNLMSGGECYGQDMQRLNFVFVNPFQSDAELCLACLFAFWMTLADVTQVCPTDCLDDETADALCGTLDVGEGGGPFGARGGGAPAPDLVGTLRSLRDQVMASSTAGQRYTGLYTTHSGALARVVPLRPWLVWMVGDASAAWLPALQALVSGQGAGVTITQTMMDDWLAILAELQAGAPPATATAIQQELDRLDLPSFVGLTMDEARARFEERGADGGGGPSGCGDGFGGADCALAELLATGVCGTDTPDPKLGALLQKRVGKARDTLAKAAASTKAGKTKKLVRRTAKQLGALQRKVRKAKATSDACRTTLDGMVDERRALVTALGG